MKHVFQPRVRSSPAPAPAPAGCRQIRLRDRLIRLLGIAVLLLLVAAAPAQDEAERSEEEIVEEILELERRIEALLRELSPAAREKLDQRRGEPREPGAPQPGAPATSETATPSEPAEPVEATDMPAAEPAYEPLRRRRRRPACNTLLALDENGDGRVTAADRYWRYLYLWVDRDGDRRWTESEIQSAFELGVREIATSLEVFVHAKGGIGEIRVDEHVMLDLRGDGFGGRRVDDGALTVDAGSLRRGDGPELLSPEGEPLAGFEPLRAGLGLRLADGTALDLNCP